MNESARMVYCPMCDVAVRANVTAGWLNAAVKGYLSSHGDFGPYLELPNLRVFVARPEYLLAMKCAAMRLGEEFHDLDDVRYLLRYLNIERVEHALSIVTQYFDESLLLPKPGSPWKSCSHSRSSSWGPTCAKCGFAQN